MTMWVVFRSIVGNKTIRKIHINSKMAGAPWISEDKQQKKQAPPLWVDKLTKYNASF